MERYEALRDIGSDNFGVAKLVKDKSTGELYSVKYIERGNKIDEHVQREIMNHRSLKHPNVIAFKKVLLTPSHLAIVMEYAARGELFERICAAGRFSEDEARFFFQQLISGVSYCHSMQICHRDLKLENTLLDGSSTPRHKICDFGYSKSSVLHSQPKYTVGTPAYIALEVLLRKQYDGKRIVGVQYTIPDYIRISKDCRNLSSRIFVTDPGKRITILEIKTHPWFTKDLSSEFASEGDTDLHRDDAFSPPQDVDEIVRIIQEARTPGDGLKLRGHPAGGSMDLDDIESDADIDVESSGNFVCATDPGCSFNEQYNSTLH